MDNLKFEYKCRKKNPEIYNVIEIGSKDCDEISLKYRLSFNPPKNCTKFPGCVLSLKIIKYTMRLL